MDVKGLLKSIGEDGLLKLVSPIVFNRNSILHNENRWDGAGDRVSEVVDNTHKM